MKDTNKLCKILFLMGMFLLSFIFFNLVITTTLFIFKVSVIKASAIISLGLSILLSLYLLNKNDLLNKKYSIITIAIPIMIIISSIFISSKIYDWSWDGDSYHKLGIGMIMDGWNPLYEKIEDFDKNKETPMYPEHYNTVWDNHYAKGAYIYGANIAKITGNIESGKSINIISMVTVFLFVFSILYNEKKKILFPLLFSICVITCPVICVQLLINYNDLLVYLYFFLTIGLFFMFEKSDLFENNNIFLLIYFMTLVISINIKASLFGYVGIYCLGYFIWYIYRIIKKQLDKKFFIKFIITSAISVLIGVFIVGLSVYPKNYIEKGNPFYPLFGNDKIDIITSNSPDYFKEKSALEKYVISMYSKLDNILESSKRKAEYKIPFTVYPSEFESLIFNYDNRISGNGIFFSGIFTISIIITIVFLFKCKNNDKDLFVLIIIPLVITILMILFFNEAWWARYFPQSYLFVFSAVLLMEKYYKNFIPLGLILISIILINSTIMLVPAFNYSLKYKKIIELDLESIKQTVENNDCNLEIYSPYFNGNYFVIRTYLDNYKNIKYLTKEEYSKNMSKFKPIMFNKINWRCNNEEISSINKSEALD